MTATLESVLNRAASQVGGYFPGNSPYGVWYDSAFNENKGTYDNAQFCAMGLSWVFYHEGANDIFPMHAYTPSGVAAFKARGQWHPGTAGIQPGDILFFDFPGAPNRVSHVGIATSSWKSGVDTIEFNTSGTAGGDQRNGRTVARKRRTASIVGYGRPNYGGSAGTPPGRTGVNVTSRPNADIQRLVGAEPDGIYGPDTTAKVAAWQGANGLVADGDWGPLSDAKGFPAAPSLPSKGPIILAAMYKGTKTGLEDDWQRSLREMGYTSVGTVDGDYGNKTVQATRNFQAARGLNPDGAAGPVTVSQAWLADGDRVLALGDTGPDVVLLQRVVGVNPDAVFGPDTKAAVQAVQRHFGVEADGVVGPVFVNKYREAAR